MTHAMVSGWYQGEIAKSMSWSFKISAESGRVGIGHKLSFIKVGEYGEARFIALQEDLDAITALEHAKVLQLICFNNPVPDDWLPLPETREGAVEKPKL